MKTRSVIGLVGLSVTYMWLMPYGSFSPLHYGFYLSILSALVSILVIYWGFRKYGEK